MNEKKLKRFQIKEYPNIQVEAGTMDRNTLKACYIEIKGTFESLQEDRVKSINHICRKISHTIERNINTDLFRKEFIFIKDISDSYVFTGKSFTKLECTLFIKKPTDFDELTVELNQLMDKVWEENIQDGPNMKFYKLSQQKRTYSKKSKEKVVN